MPHYHVWQQEQKVARRGSWVGPHAMTTRPFPGKRWQLRRFPDSTQHHGWSPGSETSTVLPQPIPNSSVWAHFFYCPICRLICMNKSPVCFCSWHRYRNHPPHFQNKKQIISQFGSELLLAVSVWHETNTHRLQQGRVFDVDTRNINYKPSGQCLLLLRLNIRYESCLLWLKVRFTELFSVLLCNPPHPPFVYCSGLQQEVTVGSVSLESLL